MTVQISELGFFILIAILIVILIIYIQWLFIMSAVRAGVKEALQDTIINAKLVNETEENQNAE